MQALREQYGEPEGVVPDHKGRHDKIYRHYVEVMAMLGAEQFLQKRGYACHDVYALKPSLWRDHIAIYCDDRVFTISVSGDVMVHNEVLVR